MGNSLRMELEAATVELKCRTGVEDVMRVGVPWASSCVVVSMRRLCFTSTRRAKWHRKSAPKMVFWASAMT